MKKIWQKLLRNKGFYIFAILIILMFPTTLYAQSDKDKTLVVTSIGIDKKEDNYTLTTLAVIPKGSNDVNANLEVFSGEGKTISEALKNISYNSGKKVGLSHCDTIILSLDATENNISTMLDYFIRTSNLSTNASIIVSDKDAKELIDASKSSNNYLDLSLKSIVAYQEDNSFMDDITIEKFYKTYYTESSTFYLPIVSIQSSSESGSSSEGGGAGSSGNQSGGGSEQSGGGESGGSEEKKIKNDERILLLKNGKKERELTPDEIFIYSLISADSDNLKIKLEKVNDEYVTDSLEVFQQVDKTVFTKYKFDAEGKPYVHYDVWLSIMLDELSSEVNYSYSAIDSLQNFISPTVEKLINDQVKEKLKNTISEYQKDNNDILGYYEKYHAYHTKDWKRYIDTLSDQHEYMENLDIAINLHLNYVI